MPNKDTLDSPVLRQPVLKYARKGLLLDPFARKANIKQYLPPEVQYVGNDINTNYPNDFNEDFNVFLDRFETCDILLADPPYSSTQIKRVYDSIGIDSYNGHSFYHDLVKHVQRMRPTYYIQYGWHSNGVNSPSYDKIYHLVVAHGGSHHDTQVTVWKNNQTELGAFF